MAETSTSTVLFTDLVDSTRLRAEIGEEAADGIRRAHDDRLGQVVDRHNGTVVKGGGDGLLCTFDAASDAIASAVEMQQAVDQLADELDARLAIRIGVSVGDVTWEDGDCFGMPVVEAARLEGSAQPGQILVSEYVKVMARGRGGHELEVRGELDLKGVPEPVMAYEVRWAPLRRSVSRYEATPYVGRLGELDRLAEAWRRVGEGQAATVLIEADAGMGKSRLIEQFRTSLAPEAIVLAGTCHAGEMAPYGALAEAISSWARDEPDLGTLLGGQASVLATMVPVLGELLDDVEPPPPVEPDIERRRLHEALVQLLERLSRRAPVLVVIDDLHWIDLGSLSAVRAIARERESRRVMIVAAFRPLDVAESDERMTVLNEIEREAEPERIQLEGLTADDIGSLLRRMGEVDEVPDEFVAMLRNRSEGNPLFIRETLLNIVADGTVARDETGNWSVTEGDIEVPSVLRNVIERRLAGLGDATRALLGIGALFEAGFPLDVTAEVAGLGEDGALDAIDEALDAQIVEPLAEFDHYRFTHAMYRHVLVDGHNPSRRPRLHRRIAEELEKRLAVSPSAIDIARLTRQFLASADLPGAERGVPYALDQARALEKAASFEEAGDAYEMADRLLPDEDERRPGVLVDIARMAALSGLDRDELVGRASAARDALHDAAGPNAAVTAVVAVARLVAARDIMSAWALADLVRPLHRGDRDADWVWLRAWELAAADWNDETFRGLPRDTAARRELSAAARDLNVVLPFESGFLVADAEEARAFAAHANHLEQAKIYGFVTGDFDRAEAAAVAAREEGARVGDDASALFACSIEARLHMARGDIEGYETLMALGATHAARMRDLSNPVLQYFGASALCEMERNPTEAGAGEHEMADFVDVRNPDTHWLSALIQSGAMTRAAAMADPEYPRLVREALEIVESSSGGVANYVYFVGWVVDSMAIANQGVAVEQFERAIRERILAGGFHYLESSPLRDLGTLASLRGDLDAAREWYATARAETSADGRILVDTRTMVRAVEAELRAGADRDAARIDAMLDELDERVEWLRLEPGWRPFAAEARSLNAGPGLAFNPPLQA